MDRFRIVRRRDTGLYYIVSGLEESERDISSPERPIAKVFDYEAAEIMCKSLNDSGVTYFKGDFSCR